MRRRAAQSSIPVETLVTRYNHESNARRLAAQSSIPALKLKCRLRATIIKAVFKKLFLITGGFKLS